MSKECYVCGATEGIKACASCKKVYYCGKEHQARSWDIHKVVCKNRTKASFSDDALPPKDLLHLATATNLTSLCLSFDCDEGIPEIDLAMDNLCFPNLKNLELDCVNIKSITFTTKNTPKLETLNMSSLPSEYIMDLQLPELKHIQIEHVMLRPSDEGFDNHFGLSLSRCPKVESVLAYKFRNLGEFICILPNCVQFTCTRSELTPSMEFCYAPKLTELVLTSGYEIEKLRFCNMKNITLDIIEELGNIRKTIEYIPVNMLAEHNAEHPEEAITLEELPKKNRKLLKKVNAAYAIEYAKVEQQIRNKPEMQEVKSRNLPKCYVNITNLACIDKESVEHLKRNRRLEVVSSSFDDMLF